MDKFSYYLSLLAECIRLENNITEAKKTFNESFDCLKKLSEYLKENPEEKNDPEIKERLLGLAKLYQEGIELGVISESDIEAIRSVSLKPENNL